MKSFIEIRWFSKYKTFVINLVTEHKLKENNYQTITNKNSLNDYMGVHDFKKRNHILLFVYFNLNSVLRSSVKY